MGLVEGRAEIERHAVAGEIGGKVADAPPSPEDDAELVRLALALLATVKAALPADTDERVKKAIATVDAAFAGDGVNVAWIEGAIVLAVDDEPLSVAIEYGEQGVEAVVYEPARAA